MARNSDFITAHEAKNIDFKARDSLGIPTLVLMENAGRQVAQEALKMLHRGKRVVIFCGKGNNGGDGFVAARHLLVKGIRPDIFLAGKINAVENEARQNLDILLRLKTKIIEVAGENLYLLKNRVLRYNLKIGRAHV